VGGDTPASESSDFSTLLPADAELAAARDFIESDMAAGEYEWPSLLKFAASISPDIP
jgi:hypothetical protein